MTTSSTKTGLRVYKQVVHRQPAAVDEDRCVDDKIDVALRCHRVEQAHKRDNEYKVVGEEAEQLTEGVMPVGSEHAVEEVEGVAEEDTAKDDG